MAKGSTFAALRLFFFIVVLQKKAETYTSYFDKYCSISVRVLTL
jgi:hypothetical protein